MNQVFYICFFVLGMGLPLLAKNAGVDRPTPSTSSKLRNKDNPYCPPAPVAKDREQIKKKSEVTLTPDISRGSVCLALISKQESSSSASAVPALRESTPLLASKDGSVMICPYGLPSPHASSGLVSSANDSDQTRTGERLARVTAYWAAEGDYYTERHISSTGVRLHDGHCAVDPSIIPYGSVVDIAGVGKFLAVDTGSAVVSRTAAREGGHTPEERHAIVVDLYFEDRSEGEKFAAGDAKYVSISWWTPTSMGLEARAARSLFAEEDWTRIQGKQL